jgi:hypothetical protein
MGLARKLWQRGLDALPVTGYHFDRPIVLLQSDDWGRVGLRDQAGLEQLRGAGIELGERPYDFYSLETADDVSAVADVFGRHRDSVGRNPCLLMNFIVANVDFGKASTDTKGIPLRQLADGLPDGWSRPGLLDSYRNGINAGVISAALHGTTHFCRASVERALTGNSERSSLIRNLWRVGTPYIHWRMPWIGYEYWDPEQSEDERFLPPEAQRDLIGQAVGGFAKLFGALPRSACAPGYRANDDTHRGWSQHGIRVAQSGPGRLMPPFVGPHDLLHLTRTVEFEPAIDPNFSVDRSLLQAKRCFELGIPAIVSIHSINFHSAVRDFRSGSLRFLNEFFNALESQHDDLLYLHDEDLSKLVRTGTYESPSGPVTVRVSKTSFTKARAVRQEA